MFDKSEFSKRMKLRRKRFGLTVTDLAKRIHVDRKSLAQWENPQSCIMPRDIQTLDRWCSEVGLSLGDALDNRLMPGDGVTNNPTHLCAIRRWYARYVNDKPFAQIIHRLVAMDTASIDLINQIISRIADVSPEQKKSIADQDRLWEKLLDVEGGGGMDKN